MMRWQKRGQLLTPPLGVAWSSSHAALPAVDSDGDHHRLYFSTRDPDGRSRLARAALHVDGETLSVGPVEPELLPLGELGTFDDSGTACACVIRDGDRVLLYYTGWSLGASVPFHLHIGVGLSTDGGQTFTRVSRAPIFDRTNDEPFLSASPSIVVEDGLWRAWYVAGTAWTEAGHRYRIHYAESDDGISWRRPAQVAIDYADGREYALGRPCVIRDADRYRMWFSHRGDAYRLGYAESSDGFEWVRDDRAAGVEPGDGGWDSEMITYPWVFDCDGVRFMLYNGNAYGGSGIGYAIQVA